jgi:hypothetical protein
VRTRFPLVLLSAALMLAPVSCASTEPPRRTPSAAATQATFEPSKFEAQLGAAGTAITLFHLRLDQRNYRGIYAMTDETFRAATSEAQLTAMLTSLRERLGRSTAVYEQSYEVVDRTPDVQISFVLETTFENGKVTETFVWRVTPDEMAHLVSYQTR